MRTRWHLVDGLHGEVPRHELADRFEALEGRSDRDAGEASLRDRGVHHPLRAKLIVEPPGHLVGAVVLADLCGHKFHGFQRVILMRAVLKKMPLMLGAS